MGAAGEKRERELLDEIANLKQQIATHEKELQARQQTI